MNRLRVGIAIALCASMTTVGRADDPSGAPAKDSSGVSRDLSIGASLASKAAADALLSPSATQRFATSKPNTGAKPGSESVGGQAAVAAAAGASGTAVDTPLPVRKPKPALAAGAKSYESANGKLQTVVDAVPPPAKSPEPAKTTGGKADTAKSETKADPKAATGVAVKSEAGTKPEDATKAAAKKPAEATEWPAKEVELAKARCTQLLKEIDAVAVPETPFRKGDCGSPAPVRLVSIGKNPEVAVSPPALLSCDMVASLHKWLKGDLQPLARKHLGADIVRIDAMSDYSCRRAYGRIANRLSEHGRANALDIRGFITAKAKTAYVLEEWGPTRRDVLKKLAAAKAEAEKADAARLEAEKKAQDNLRDPKTAVAGDKTTIPPAGVPTASGAPAGGIAKTTIIDGLSKITVTLPGARPDSGEVRSADAPSGMGIAPRRLGGPKDGESGEDEKPAEEAGAKPGKDAKAGEKTALGHPITTGSIASPPPRTATSRFLHEAHIAACRIFGTTLGPEANEAHRNHFHVDMAERKLTKICE